MNKIDPHPPPPPHLPVTAKLQAINTTACSKLNFYFSNLTFTVKILKAMEDCSVRHVQGWLKLNNSSTRSFMFTSRYEGGLGIFNPSALYSAKHLSFRLPVLNSDDEQVPETARSSLALHMQKRKVPEAPMTDNAFCGFQTTDKGNLAKTSRVTWPRSD
ncbi:hypothetical protein ACOMHN_047197 [Nucella lapillus]